MNPRNIFLTGVKSETNIVRFLLSTLIFYYIYISIISIPLAFYIQNESDQMFYSAILGTVAILIHLYYEITN